MRSYRILTGILGFALVGLMTLFHTGAAQAAADEHARALPKREIKSDILDKGNRLIFKGNVNPGHANKTVIIQKRTCKTDKCNWYAFKKVTTNDRGGFKQRITAPKKGYFYWRAKVQKYGGYGTSYSSAWRTYTI